MPFDVTGALSAGYDPAEILDHLSKTGGTFDVSGARKAGYSDDEIVQHLVSQQSAGASADTSIGNAAAQSLLHQLPAGLERGAAGAMRYAERVTGREAPDVLANADALDQRADANEAAITRNYRRPDGAPTSLVDAVKNANGPLDAAKRVGSDVLRSSAENLGYLGAGLGSAAASLAAPEGIAGGLIGGGLFGLDSLLNLGAVRDTNKAAGLNPNNVSSADLANALAQSALMRASPLGAEGNVATRLAGAGATAAGKGAAQAGMNDVSALSQGGDLGGSPASRIGSDMLEAGAAGLPIGVGLHGAGELSGAVATGRNNSKAGANLRAFADETRPWNDAVQQAAADITQKNPGMAPEDVQDAAYRAASQSGVEPPSFSTLSPEAQNGQAELAALRMYQGRRDAETTGMGRPNTDMTPAATFQGMKDDIVAGLTETTGLLKANDLISPDQAKTLTGAIEEARRRNRIAAEQGDSFSYFDTLRDKVAALPIDPKITDQLLGQLRVLDVASRAGLEKNSRGPLERNSGHLAPLIGAGAGYLMHGLPFTLEGGLGGALLKAQAASMGRNLDKVMGWGLPDLLQRQKAIEDYASRNNLSPSADPMALQEINRSLAGLGQPEPAPASPQGGPVTAGPNANMGARPAFDPAAAAVAAQSQPQVVNRAPAAAPVAPAEPLANLKAVLQARADAKAQAQAKLAEAVQAALPSNVRGWQAAIAGTVGPHVTSGTVRDFVNANLPAETASALLGSHEIPKDAMRAITNAMVEAFPHPEATQAGNAQAASPSPVRNPLSYAANLAQEKDTADNIIQNNPDLSGVANRMRDPLANGKTSAGRGQVLDSYLNGIADPAERARQEAILRPLAGFGQKTATTTPGKSRTAPGSLRKGSEGHHKGKSKGHNGHSKQPKE